MSTMGIFFRETKDNWDRVEEALATFRRTDRTEETFAALEADVLEALEPVRINKPQLWNHIAKLCRANNIDRALKLVNVARSDVQPQLWFWLIFSLVSWPFRLVWRIIKLGLPG